MPWGRYRPECGLKNAAIRPFDVTIRLGLLWSSLPVRPSVTVWTGFAAPGLKRPTRTRPVVVIQPV